MRRLPRKDVAGKRFKVGDIVRIVGVPDLTGMSADCLSESLPVFPAFSRQLQANHGIR
jgi:hypothetical protein